MCLVSFSRQSNYSALEKLESFAGRPRWAYINITEGCSHHCPWCYGQFGVGAAEMMQPAAFGTCLEKLGQMGIAQITLSGGEPTEHPNFAEFLRLCRGFHLHVASHGQHIDHGMAGLMAKHAVRQVQLNFQGSRDHDRIHGVESYQAQARAVPLLLGQGIEVTATVTVGEYNIDRIGEIFREAASLGATRLRVWEATGRGRSFSGGLEPAEVFRLCAEEAARLGYPHSLSYDPAFSGDINVPCLQLSNLYMYVNVKCELMFCGAVSGGPVIADLLSDDSEAIMENYLGTNRRILGGCAPWCVSRHDDLLPHEQNE